MVQNTPDFTKKHKEQSQKLTQLQQTFLDLYTRHKHMVEDEAVIMTSIYLKHLGTLQLELLEKQTEVSRLNMKMMMIQAAINRNEKPDLDAIEADINKRLEVYYAQIKAKAKALDQAKEVLSHLLPPDEVKKLKEVFRLLCKRLHPDLNPNQTDAEKDLFIKVKAAYDLQQLEVLQKILLSLKDPSANLYTYFTEDERDAQIMHLEQQIASLEDKIEELQQNFPFDIANWLFDENYIAQKQEEIKLQIQHCEEDIKKYEHLIYIMTDE